MIEGRAADVITLGLAYAIDAIAEPGLINVHWQKRSTLPDAVTRPRRQMAGGRQCA